MKVSQKNALILEPFDRFKKFKRLNWLEFNFLLIGHTVRFQLSTRQRDQRDKIIKKQVCWNYLFICVVVIQFEVIYILRLSSFLRLSSIYRTTSISFLSFSFLDIYLNQQKILITWALTRSAQLVMIISSDTFIDYYTRGHACNAFKLPKCFSGQFYIFNKARAFW